jgi:hypothetical protein
MTAHLTGPLLEKGGPNPGTREWFSGLPMGAMPDLAVMSKDFTVASEYAAADYTATVTGSGTTAVSTSAINGALVLTNSAANADAISMQSKQVCWKLVAGKRAWFEAKLQMSDPTKSDLFVGLANTDTTPLDATDRIGFRITNGAATIAAQTSVGGSATSTATGQSAVAATDITLGIAWDGGASLKFFINRALTNTITTNIATAAMALTIHLANGEAVAKTATIDYVFVAKER